MPIQVVPHTQSYSSAVEAFNRRMKDGGSKWGFYTNPVPDWIPKSPGSRTWREYHLAVDEADNVRGGYALKPQEWLIHGEAHLVTDWQGPFTEAAIDVKYSPLMLKLFRTMLKEHPLLFSLGHGGTEEPIIDLLAKMKWDLHAIPFAFAVLRPYRFARHNSYLRTTALRRFVMDLFAYSGLAYLGVKFLSMWRRRRSDRVTVDIVNRFELWADELWDAHKTKYTCLAVRDSEMMNALLPQVGWPGGTRLKVSRGGEVIGWSIVHDKQMTDDPRFGSLHVGLITDCFADPDDATAVIQASHDYLASQNVDMIYANLSHPAWIQATRNCGYIVLENRRIFAVSPALQEKLEPFEETSKGLHLTNMDGHGPHGFQ